MTAFAILALLSQITVAQTVAVRHNHDPGGGCTGTLTIDTTGVRFHTERDDHSRDWPWTEIQTLDLASSTQVSVRTYEDQRWLFGRDRPFDFTLTGGELDRETIRGLSQALPKPITVRLLSELTADYQIAVKHQHRIGGCQGTLRFGTDWISYETEHARDRRIWRKDRDLAAVWSQNAFALQLQVYERDADLGSTRMFRFQLKEPLDSRYYEMLRRELLPAR